MDLSLASTGLPELVAGKGFYKLGYVTTDRERAITALSEHYGYGKFRRFDPDMEVTTERGTGRARLRCAFTVGHHIVIEVMEPIDGQVDIFREPLTLSQNSELAFHHVGVLVDDFEAATKAMAGHGLHPAWHADAPGMMKVSYTRLPLLGHFVELVEYADRGASLIPTRGHAVG